jgi:pimeloyl-ACP methyl ester carboxylesterase
MPDLYDNPVHLTHGRVKLALHELRGGDGPTLLLLHGVAEHSPSSIPSWATSWTAAVHALDFTGHGASTRPRGGGYTAELMMADVDAAVARLGPVTIVGRGLGGYIALLIAGSRGELIRGIVIADGPGLDGGPTGFTSTAVVTIDDGRELAAHEPDPFAVAELSRDVRPPDYAATFARRTLEASLVDPAIIVSARSNPHWLDAVAREPGVQRMSLPDAVAHFSK